ncbi:probable AMS1-alpha-mannosidase [Sporisorium reilianum SRZ2]|uniref:alpha-mannosidase n=1 Tax=Sporisorium reilianum (strain SRZ2) TaxID=999809 RepID=E6ZKW8_SPORE|nr:probable AMS1-alpha-mannosidase [Sporisorium reilianum SRZ2]
MCQHGRPQATSKSADYPTHASAEPRPVRAGLIRSVHERRLEEFVGGQFGDYNLASMLFEARTDDPKYVSIQSWTPKAGSKPTFDEAKRQTYLKADKSIKFGPSWTNHWLKLKLTVPKDWVKKEWLQLEFDPGCEALIYSEDGLPLQGITGGGDKRRVDFPLKPEYRNGITFYIEVTANGMFGMPADGTGDPDPNRYFDLASCDIVVKRPEAWKLMWDFEHLQGCVQNLPRDTELQNRALWVANQIQNTFRKGDLDSITKCRKLAQEILGKDWDDKIETIYDRDVVEGREDVRIWSLGHSHIDSAWLWPYSATQQKVARSWSTQIDLMDRFPEHRFTASTAQQYQWLETLYPKLFDKLKKYVEDGRFQPIGGSWVECDANMPSGEAFARQFLYGQRYFKSRFGKRCDIFWLPDTFGYNAQIPQLARQSGCDYFFTQKLSWNNINRFPHNTLMWVGLDGTQIIVHMTPVNNYDSRGYVEEIVRGVKNNTDLWVQPHALMLYGFGDGGGGPSEEMIERMRRARAVNNNGFKDMPRVHVGRSAKDFFEHVREVTDNGNRLSTWSGEIYLEFHRGVYTSHGSIKQWNRRFEAFMQKLEWLTTLASIKASGYKYPKEEIDAIWEPLLLNQFHDCLPGSSIRKVYDDLEEMYADMTIKGKKLWRQALNALGVGEEVVASGNSAYTAINTLDVPRRELVEVQLSKQMPRAEAIALSHQSVQLCKAGQTALVLLEDVTGRGHATVVDNANSSFAKSQGVKAVELEHNSFLLQSSAIAVKVAKGRITSIYDRIADRELIEGGRTAGLAISEDYPPQFDNWETELYSLDTEEEIPFTNVRIAEAGPWRASLALEAKFGQSTVQVSIVLDAVPATTLVGDKDARPLLRFDTQIDWWEKHRFLRFNVPTRLRSDSASFETQFGITKRPTTRNTSWEAAKFEVCGHRFADLSEEDYGLSILTESKYGYSVEGGLMRLSLLKAGTYPDAHEDEGLHQFAFALYPHVGGVGRAKVVQVARVFNARFDVDYSREGKIDIATLERSAGTSGADLQMPIEIVDSTRAGVVIDTIKRAEDDFEYYGQKPKDAHSFGIVVRLYESLGAHAKPTIKIKLPVKEVNLTNLLEDVQDDKKEEIAFNTYADEEDSTYVQLDLKPFEIKTLKISI